ncbi:MerR family transcriptional regulator [Alloscardovia omnicolens]|uniref:MerR family transcriptional regulator n=1 Tax=Alloscardovia omnicolens TaxID=419015 RepID=UPI003A752525
MNTPERTYTITEVAKLTGLAASTLRYYESVGICPAIQRDDSSGHRIYTQSNLDFLSWVSCLAATGMSIENMRQYIHNGKNGARNSALQVQLLTEQDAVLKEEAARIRARRKYIEVKIKYWKALEARDTSLAQELAQQASDLIHELR